MNAGELIYLGRNDDQIKIRGFRIEPQEIEEMLLKHTEIQQCLVISEEKVLINSFVILLLVKNHITEASFTSDVRK